MKTILFFLLLIFPVFAQEVSGEVKIKGQDNRYIQRDYLSGALITIDFAHHELHEGNHFYVAGYKELTNAESLIVAVSVPDMLPKRAHHLFDIVSEVALTTRLYEGATIAGGDTITPMNNDRESANTAELIYIINPTVSNFGTALPDSNQWGAAGTNRAGGGESREEELLLKNNAVTLYLLVSGGNSNSVHYHGNWYEHTTGEE